jgi:hypothetical protein
MAAMLEGILGCRQIPYRAAAMHVGVAMVGVGMGMRGLQIPSGVAATLEEILRSLQIPCRVAAVVVPQPGFDAGQSIPWISLSSHHQYLFASSRDQYTIFVPFIH